MHLLLTSTEDLFDPHAWSGTAFSLRSALEQQVLRLSVFTPPRPRRTPVASVLRALFGAKHFPLWITRATLRQNARTLQAEIARLKPDAVLAIGSQAIIFLRKPGVPVFLFSDAPYLAFSEAYAAWQPSPRRLHTFAAEEAAAARTLDGLCFGSRWACDQALSLYQLPSPGRLHVTPLGANWVPTESREQIFATVEARIATLASGPLELLFVGKDWERKGGPLAVQIASAIHRSGRAVRLHIVGSRPALEPSAAAYTSVHGILQQSDPEQSAQLAELFRRSHFLLVPTLAECFGLVFAEAQAFALPPVSRAVHAVPSVILDGKSGFLFPLEAPAQPYADRILALAADPAAYRHMAHAAREWFEQTLTWQRTAEAILKSILAAVSSSLP